MQTYAAQEAKTKTVDRKPALPYRLSIALSAVAAVTSALSLFFFAVFERDAPGAVGNMR